MQQSSGGSSGGGGGNGGGGGTPQAFSAEGKVYGVNAENADSYVIKVYNLDGSQREGLWHPNANGNYKIEGLPLNIVLIVVVEKDALQMKNLAWGTSAGDTKDADLTPTSTVAVEVISANATARALLENFDSSADIDDTVANVQDGVNDYYESHSQKLTDLIDAADDGVSLTETIASDLSDIETAAIETHMLTVNISPFNTGTVSPNGGTFLKGTKVKLQAKGSTVGDTRYFFKNWSGANVSDITNNEITMSGDKTISAEFMEGFVLWYQTADEAEKEFSPTPLAGNQIRILVDDDGDGDEEVPMWHDYEELVYAKNTEVTFTYTPVPYGGQPAPDVKDVVRVGFHGTTKPLEVDEQGHVANWGSLSGSRHYINGESGHNTVTININRNVVLRELTRMRTYPLQNVTCVVNGDADEWGSLPEYPLSGDPNESESHDIKLFINSAKLGKNNDNLYVLINYIPTDNQALEYIIELCGLSYGGSEHRQYVYVRGVNGSGEIQCTDYLGQVVGEAKRDNHTLEVFIPKALIEFFNTKTILCRIRVEDGISIDSSTGSLQSINF
jgi:hypothetical protein